LSACLCLIAHPDDETMLCGGTLALLAARGVDVHLACLTRGEGGELGEPPITDREYLGDVRTQELACAALQLGCRAPRFLGYVDPVVGPGETLFAPEHDFDALVDQIKSLLVSIRASVLLTHGSNGEYGHPAHQLVHRAALSAAAHPALTEPGRPPVIVYSFAATYPNHRYPRLANVDDPADLIVDVSAALDQKEAAARCHASQNALFVRRRSEAAGRPLTVREILLTEESFHRHWPASAPHSAPPPAADPFLAWLRPSDPAAASTSRPIDQVTN
jgi:LmbE family N-acetylglucosaminyl deacetylase